MSISDGPAGVMGDVLIVDALPADQKLLADTLGRLGHRVQQTDDGELAVRSIEARRPDLVILDLRRPGLEAPQICRRLNPQPSSPSPPSS